MGIEKEEQIRAVVRETIEKFASGFCKRHLGKLDDPTGVINRKKHNIFIAALGPETTYYAALVRSLDSTLGNRIEKMGIRIAKLFYDYKSGVEGPLAREQTAGIAHLLAKYKQHELQPSVDDYQFLRDIPAGEGSPTRDESDYYLIDRETNTHHLVELKIGGDLDNKKARSEKESLLEQFAILSNTLPREAEIRCQFATAYNLYGSGNRWHQGRVLQYFAREELLIGKDFWNFVCNSPGGYEVVLDEYGEVARVLRGALDSIRGAYFNSRGLFD